MSSSEHRATTGRTEAGSTHADRLPRRGVVLANRYAVSGPAPGQPLALAKDRTLGRQVSIYPLGDDDGRDAGARAAVANSHPAFARLFDVVEHGGSTYLVVEHVAGSTLVDIAAKERPRPGLVVDVGTRLAEALDAAVQVGGRFSRIALDRVVRARDGALKLYDYGDEDGDGDGGFPEDERAAEAARALASALLAFAGLSATKPSAPASLGGVLQRGLLAATHGGFASPGELGDALRGLDEEALARTQAIPRVPVAREEPRAERVHSTFETPRRLPFDRRLLLLIGAAAVVLLGVLAAPWLASQLSPAPHCARGVRPAFQGSLGELHARLGDVMGSPRECAHGTDSNGDVQQATSSGLAYVRRSSGAASFTNGWEHWALTPRGLLYWTGDAVDPPRDAAVVTRGVRPEGGGTPKP